MCKKEIVVRASGRVEGIPHLYRASSGRFYVRYSKGGVDRTRTLPSVDSPSFTWLVTVSAREFKALKKEVDGLQPTITPKTTLERGQNTLPDLITRLWTEKGVSRARIRDLLGYCEGLAVCKDSKRAGEIDAYNNAIVKERYSAGDNTTTKKKVIEGIQSVFKVLIARGYHAGTIPSLGVNIPVAPRPRESFELSFEQGARVIHAIRESNIPSKKELELFMLLAIETGQRPTDLHHFTTSALQDGHYRFLSLKTGRYQRVSHLFSDKALALIAEVKAERGGVESYTHKYCSKHRGLDGAKEYTSFWSMAGESMQKALNGIIKKTLGEDSRLYGTRQNFVSRIFQHTQSTFYAALWTHDGENVNQNHYLKNPQTEADSILINAVIQPFEALLDGNQQNPVQGKREVTTASREVTTPTPNTDKQTLTSPEGIMSAMIQGLGVKKE